jgi:hypothetical protein
MSKGKRDRNVLDRYLTKEPVLERLATIVKTYIEPGMIFVDFSCGRNTFAPRLDCQYVSYDIMSVKDAIQKDWLTIKTLPSKNIACGLNPPFGYQGKTARQFIEHACKFGPHYFFLILPHMRWTPPDYESIYIEKLLPNSFYTEELDGTEKDFSYPTWFHILKRKTVFGSNQSSAKIPNTSPLMDMVQITRRWIPETDVPTLVVRRVGRNTGKQAYCIVDGNISFVEKGSIHKNITWKDNNHSIESDYYLKCYFKEETLSLVELEALSLFIGTHPEPGSETKQPPATTNHHFKQMIMEWLSTNK